MSITTSKSEVIDPPRHTALRGTHEGGVIVDVQFVTHSDHLMTDAHKHAAD